MTVTRTPWWKRTVFYQIYPKSFRDVTGDGVGDIRGITAQIPYLQRLGVGALWLSPVFASPMVDNGYDVSDYKAVNPLFGTMADVEDLIAAVHGAGLRLVFDIALNHTSIDHPWFQDALAGGEKRDWYHWRDGRCGAAPNNWQSIFGGPAWSKPEGHDQFYLHLFDRTQADLNWDNPAVRAAIHDAMRFWLTKGVDGFRLDVVTVISKTPDLRDVVDPRPAPLYRHLADGPRLHEFLREMRREVFSHFDCVAIGEAPGVDPARAAKLVDPADPILDMIYHFDHVAMNPVVQKPWDRRRFKRVFSDWDTGIGPHGWNSVVLSNHDLGRVVSRFGNGAADSAKAFMTLVLLQRASPFIYQGDEIGMTNCAFAGISELDDVWAKTTYAIALQEGLGPDAAFQRALAMTRDHARTPMQWTGEAGAGFSEAKPWLPLNPNAAHINVAQQEADPDSVLAYVRALIALRRNDPLWIEGAYEDLAPEDPHIFRFARTQGLRRAEVAINLGSEPVQVDLPRGGVLLANRPAPHDRTVLHGWEARVIMTDEGP